MRKIDARPEPQSMVTLRRQGASYPELGSDSSIRRTLWEQQGRRCAYCERVLLDPDLPNHNTRIEHFHPQSSDCWGAECERASHSGSHEKAAVSWGNLLLCCDGNERAGQDFTCDKSKSDIDICERFRNPRDWPTEQLVYVERDGRVVPLSGLPAEAEVVLNGVMNLNAEGLVRARKTVLSALKKEIAERQKRSRGLTAQQKTAMASRLRQDAKVREFGACFLAVASRLS
ncbi:hypothetical protein [Curtobacterium sp. DN_7.5]|uniref:hypothetical protein n=1 Tax=Curtobacterium sp. DN_7.5 TaxID=3049047 RepID=UPI001F599CBE|nr:hypothetical protein [Curtobacterium sp. DN_7.5]